MTSYLSISHLILKRKMQCKDCKFFYNNFPLVIMNTGLQGLSVLEVLQVRWLVQVLSEPEIQQRTNRQRNGKIPLPAWEAVSVLR